jgi:formate C-acetyltransferase
MRFVLPAEHDVSAMRALREHILASPIAVALQRARTYTGVFRESEGAPWIVRKALAFREHLETVPLFIREHDRIAGSICEIRGGMPLMAEIGIAENAIFTSEDRHRAGYLRGQVPQDIADYWEERNLWGRYRAYMRAVEGKAQPRGEVTQYKFLSYQGHLSPSYRELLRAGLGGIIERVRRRREGEIDPGSLEFLTAAEHCLLGVSEWAKRYSELLAAEAATCGDPGRASDLSEMSRIADRVALDPPETFREAMQLIWFVHQAIHIEGHGYSNTPDRIDQILYPFYRRDKEEARLTDDEALTLCENFILKLRDNTFWSVEHNLTQGICLAGSTPDGADQTNELSWLFIAAADNMSVPEPLVWIRWHPSIDQDFFDFCLETLGGPTCFPLMMSDTAVPYMFMELGVSREDAFNYVPAGCNELAIPGQAYFNPCAHVGYLGALEQALTQGRGYDGTRAADQSLPDPRELGAFDDLVGVVGRIMRRQVESSYASGMTMLAAQMRWGQTPLTSCFFDGCIERARDMVEGTKYNILSCGGIAFANMVDCLAAIREVVYEKQEAALEDVARACAANFEGCAALRAKLVAAPKHGNDDERLRGIISLVERLRDEPVKQICRDPRDGTAFGNCHVVRSGAVKQGAVTPATPDGRWAGTPLAASVAASAGCEKSGPTALLNSILALDPVKSWQCGYNVNMRFLPKMLTDAQNRAKVRAMLNAYFTRGGQEMQINSVDTETLRAAQANPEQYRDLVVRVAGFSEFFTKLDPRIQEDVIARTEHE